MQNNETLGRNLSRSQLHRLPFACLRLLATLSLSLVVIALSSGVAYAQDTSVGSQATREALAQRIATDEAEIAAGKVNLARRKVLTAEIAGIRERLENGDFRTGDLVVVTIIIPNANYKQTVDTSTVRANDMISITELPDISLKGVLKSEVQDKVRTHAEKYIKEPKVRVNFTTRITITGGVTRPGTYSVSPDRQLTELVTTAGGGTALARLDELEVRRGHRVILSRNNSKRALVEGKTLEQVGVQPGDEVLVPQKRTFNWQVLVQFALLISSLVFAAIQFLQFYYSGQ